MYGNPNNYATVPSLPFSHPRCNDAIVESLNQIDYILAKVNNLPLRAPRDFGFFGILIISDKPILSQTFDFGLNLSYLLVT